MTDFFGIATSSLVLFDSDDGVNLPRVVTRHYGRHTAEIRTFASQRLERVTADQTGEVEWRNPVCKYMVVGDLTLSVQLGKAFASGYNLPVGTPGRKMMTGYMITAATIETGLGRFPVVTVQGVANEGSNAINRFFVSVQLAARARAQNLLGAVQGGGELHALTLRAVCDPVVIVENMVPCASDVVGGRCELHAETMALDGEAAPSCTAAGGFTSTGAPEIQSGKDFVRYSLSAEREMI